MFSPMGQTNPEDFGNGGTIDGDLIVSGDLQVSGGGSLSFDEIVQGTQVVEITNTEALLVRKASDGGDVFIVDTTNSRVGIGGTALSQLHITQSGTTTADGIRLTNGESFELMAGIIGSTSSGFSIFDVTDNAVRLSIDTSGNVNIPQKLEIGGNLGVGVAPSSSYVLYGSGSGSPTIRLTDTTNSTILDLRADDTGALIRSTGNHPLRLNTNQVDRVTITNDGDVQLQERLTFSGTNDSIIASSITPHSNGFIYITGGSGGIVIGDDTPSSRIQILNDAEIRFEVNGSEKMRLDSTGLGIGINNPVTELHIKGSGEILRIENDTNASGNTFMSFYDTSALKGYLGFTGGSSDHYVLYNNENADMRFFTNATHYMTLDASGNLGVGTTNIDAKLVVAQASADTALKVSREDQANIQLIASGRGSVRSSASLALQTGGANVRMLLDDNSRISLGNNDSSGATSNTIFGRLAGNAIASGAIDNVLIGNEAGNDVTTGDYLVAIGSFALEKEDVGRSSIAIGASALGRQNTASEGSANTIGIGTNAGFYNVTGIDNVLIGHNAGVGADGNSHSNNVAVGSKAMFDVTTGSSNVAIGKSAGENITTGSQNTVLGTNALPTADGGEGNNVAIGMSAMMNVNNDNADDNICIGVEAGKGGTGSLRRSIAIGTIALDATGSNNVEGAVAIGYNSLGALTSGASNVAVGYQSAKNLTTGASNVSIGYSAMGNSHLGCDKNVIIGTSAFFNGEVDESVFIGFNAGGDGTTTTGANGSVGIGKSSLNNLTSGGGNTALGFEALKTISTGATSTAVGYEALELATGSGNTAIGYEAGNVISTGAENTILGGFSNPSAFNATNETVVGGGTTGQGSNTVTLGNTSVTAVYMAQDSGATVHCAGVNFPDSQVASSDANTLDDYEEGTYTPVVSNGSSNYSASVQNGYYTKIGDQVFVQVNITSSEAGSGGALQVTLPFNYNGASNKFITASVRYGGLDLDANCVQLMLGNSSSGTSNLLFFSQQRDDNTQLNLSADAYSSGDTFQFNVHYKVA